MIQMSGDQALSCYCGKVHCLHYSTYTVRLSVYYRLEQSDDKKLYTRRYRQFLLQVFSADSILQLVPNAAIQLLQNTL